MDPLNRPDTPRPPESTAIASSSSAAATNNEGSSTGRTDSPLHVVPPQTQEDHQEPEEQEHSVPNQTTEDQPAPDPFPATDSDYDSNSDDSSTLSGSIATLRPDPPVAFPGYPQNHPVIPPVLFHLWNVTGKHKLWWRVIPPLQQYRKFPASEPWRDPFPHTLPLDTPDECLPMTAERVRELIQRDLDDRRAWIAHSNGTGLDHKPLPDGGMVSASEPPPIPPRRDRPLRTSNGAGDLRIEALQEDLDYWRTLRREGTGEKGLCILLMTKIKIRIKKLGGVPDPNPRTRPRPAPPLPLNWPSPQTRYGGSMRPSTPPPPEPPGSLRPLAPRRASEPASLSTALPAPPEVHWLDLTLEQQTNALARGQQMLANFKAQAGSAVRKSRNKAKSYMETVFVREKSPEPERPELLARPGNPIEKTLESKDESSDGDEDTKGKRRARDGADYVFMRDEYISGSRTPPPIRPTVVYTGSSGQGSAPAEGSSGRQRADSNSSIRTVIRLGTSDQSSAIGEGSRKRRCEESDPSDGDDSLG